MMLAPIASIYRLILPEFRLRFFGVVGLSIVVAIFEMVGIASIMPLIAVMVDPAGVANNRLLSSLLGAFGSGGATPSVHVIGFITITLIILTNVAALVLSWISVKFSAQLAVALSEQFAYALFRRPFESFLAQSAAKLAQETCNEVAKFASGGVLQLSFAVVRAIQLVLVLALLFVLSPLFTMIVFPVIGVLYALSFRYSAHRLGTLGSRALTSSGRAMHSATEMFEMAREISLKGDCSYFVRRISVFLQEAYRADAIARVLPTVPKYALEIAAVCAIFALPIYRSLMGQDVRPELPLLATFAYAGFRLLPVIQQMYASVAILRFHLPMAVRLEEALSAPPEQHRLSDQIDRMPAHLAFDAVAYHHAGRDAAAVGPLSFGISRGERVAVVGASGAGKSTLVDLALGLLVPTEGKILVDGVARKGGRLFWKEGAVGYVPQLPLILSDTIARNIALGFSDDDIDLVRCREAASKAGIIDVVDAPNVGFDAVIGGAGLNFSGGERQRLAIARALYSNPEFLVLDEPASALDPPNARRIFDLLCEPKLDTTVLVVTHDLEYLRGFDKIVFLQSDAPAVIGNYETLVRDCAEFRLFEGDAIQQKRRLHEQPVHNSYTDA
jgi:ATP-binding cassette, subfamily B, bacterial PglK